MSLKEIRKQKDLTQAACAKHLGIPMRTYQLYESDESRCPPIKLEYIIRKMEIYGLTDENNGILTVEKIKEICNDVFSKYDVEYCYLFGSYAKGDAKENSDVDLLIRTDITGLVFFDLVELLREKLRKKVDLLEISRLNNNSELLNEILKDGIKIYG